MPEFSSPLLDSTWLTWTLPKFLSRGITSKNCQQPLSVIWPWWNEWALTCRLLSPLVSRWSNHQVEPELMANGPTTKFETQKYITPLESQQNITYWAWVRRSPRPRLVFASCLDHRQPTADPLRCDSGYHRSSLNAGRHVRTISWHPNPVASNNIQWHDMKYIVGKSSRGSFASWKLIQHHVFPISVSWPSVVYRTVTSRLPKLQILISSYNPQTTTFHKHEITQISVIFQ